MKINPKVYEQMAEAIQKARLIWEAMHEKTGSEETKESTKREGAC